MGKKNNVKQNMNILGIPTWPFSLKDLKKAFRKTIKETHPDIENGNTDKAQQAIQAKEALQKILSKKLRREKLKDEEYFVKDYRTMSLKELKDMMKKNKPHCIGDGRGNPRSTYIRN